ncbi:hypothetical protein GP476_13525 [Aeromonas dhakensis]|uniref:DUF6270 domain-containing protein n=1 Tax=Aeromonas dhakensis TaxID=196024 RepID=UPI0021B17BE6|nr:DUF6270 domain-containing protein [Aeromonas dhakensis]UXB12413.1 hypothetical protein GP476_13525 [Aeromonas dhakensis]
MKILIFGSCVSRDAISLAQDNKIELVDYYARSSLASACHDKKSDIVDQISLIESSFQRRIVCYDFNKSFINTIVNENFDLLLLDLIDERFNLWTSESGDIITLSNELLSCKPDLKNGRVIHSGSEEWFILWMKGWDRLFSVLKEKNLHNKVIVNAAFWSKEVNYPESKFTTYSHDAIEKANTHLSKMYSIINEYISRDNFIHYEQQHLTSDRDHQWGISPFHYVHDFYKHTLHALEQKHSKNTIDSFFEKTNVHYNISSGELTVDFDSSYLTYLPPPKFACYLILECNKVIKKDYQDACRFCFTVNDEKIENGFEVMLHVRDKFGYRTNKFFKIYI